MSASPPSGDPAVDKAFAELAGKIKAYCAANPEAKIKDGVRKAALGLF